MRLVWQTVIRTIRSRSEVYQCLIVKASDLMLFAMLVARSTIALLPFFQGQWWEVELSFGMVSFYQG